MPKFSVIVVSVLLCSVLAVAGTITPGLMQRYQSKSTTDLLPTLIVLSDRVNAVDMGQRLLKQGHSLAEIHKIVMDSLQQKAKITQTAVLNRIEILASAGQVKNVQSFWITNMFAADLSQAAAEAIAAMPEVNEIGYNFEIAQRPATDLVPAERRTNNIEPALNVIHARDVWNMGYRGEGRIVCNFDDGIDQSHPALSARFRGNTAPASECWWQPDRGTTPTRCGNHGTLTLGVLCGADSAYGDTIGVAPAAQWIAAKVLCSGGSTAVSNAVAAYQWAADPDNNPETFNDVPDVINNSWGTSSNCEGDGPGGWWEAIDNTEVLGPVNIIAVDNTGAEGPGSVNSPESRAASNTRNFGVGNLNGNDPNFAINVTSGRGPSPCDGQSIKPNLTAPGTNIRSSSPGGIYVTATGTSMAAPFVSGTVALMRQAVPDLTADEIKQILLRTAVDLGTPGPDNDYGWGMVNVQAAVQSAISSSTSGAIQGTARYGGTGIDDAKIAVVGTSGEYDGASNSTGAFRVENLVGNRNYQVKIGKFGFVLYEVPAQVFVPQNGSVTVYASLHRGFNDDCEFDQGWSLGVSGDDATSGQWVRAVPIPSYISGGAMVQTGSNHTPSGTKCFVTGNAPSPTYPPNTASVTGGKTTLRTPLFNLTELTDPVLHFAYFYTNDQGDNSGGDFFKVQISNDGGANWTDLINSSASPRAWQEVSFTISDFVEPTDQMLVQFIAEDQGLPSLVEAAVDDISISGGAGVPEPPTGLTLDVQFDHVLLTWHASEGATLYRVYVSGDENDIVRSEHFYQATTDTSMSIPMTSIPYDQFYFQVTATNQ